MLTNYYKHLLVPAVHPTRVVILGANGFIGQNLSGALERLGIPFLGVTSREIDLAQESSVISLQSLWRAGDAVVMAAAITPDKGRDTVSLMKNLRMVENLTKALGGTSLSHFIYLSSDAVFSEDLPPIDESITPTPISLYGLMHLTREKIIAQTLAEENIPFLILRPCAIFGRGDTHHSYGPNRFLRSAQREGKIDLIGEGEERRPHLYVDDLVEILTQALLCRTQGLLHAIPSISHSFREVARIISELLGETVTLVHRPREVPTTHKHYQDYQVRMAFPQIKFTGLADGLKKMLVASQDSGV